MKVLFRSFILCIVLLLTVGNGNLLSAGQWIPDTGAVAIAQRCRDIQSNLTVMNVTLRPGHEDLATLSYLRLGRGAQILSVYVTNGETEESDVADLFPAEIASTRRLEATSALASIEAEVNFMNFTDLAGTPAPDEIQEQWPQDTMVVRFMRLIAQFKPDLILFSSTCTAEDASMDRAVHASLLEAVHELSNRKDNAKKIQKLGLHSWVVGRIAIRDTAKSGLTVPLGSLHPVLKKTYEEIGKESALPYRSLSIQREIIDNRSVHRYRILYPSEKVKRKTLDAGLPGEIPQTLRALDKNIRAVLKNMTDKKSQRKKYLLSIIPFLADVDRMIVSTQQSLSKEWRVVLNWKEGLEKLRTALLGITVEYTLGYSVLVERQLVDLRIDTVVNLPKGGETTVLFPMVNQGWIVNETAQSKFPLRFKEPYRLITPQKVEYDLPALQYIQQRSTVNKPLTAMIVHTSPVREENFVYRILTRVQYAPRFTAEVITPIVRCIDGEKLIVRLTNHSRDPVADKLDVRDSIAYSNIARVALREKESSQQDTLTLTWYNQIPDSSYLVPIEYGGVRIAQFLGRKFSAEVDTTIRVGVMTGLEGSRTVEALRRLGIKHYSDLHRNPVSIEALQGLTTVILDRRVMTLRTITEQERQTLFQFASGGGHVLVLAQDADSWNAAPIIDQIHLVPAGTHTEQGPIQLDSSDAFLRTPNIISEKDFDGWILRRSYNKVAGGKKAGTIVISTQAGDPLLVTVHHGKGRITYVDLALTPQFMNVHPGAMRLFANLVSHGGE